MKRFAYLSVLSIALIFVAGVSFAAAEEGRDGGRMPPIPFGQFKIAASSTLPADAAGKDALILTLRTRVSALETEVKMLREQLARGVGSSTQNMMGGPLIQMPFFKKLILGNKGDDVSELQKLLKEAGVYPEGLITGYFGPLTKQAILRFEAKHGLSQDGEADDDLIGRLKGRLGTTTLPWVNASSTGLVAICHKGDDDVATTSVARHTIRIGINALKAHLDHGDHPGPCPETND